MPYIGNIVQDFSVNTAMLNTDSVTSIKIDDGTIVNADINDSAAIAGSKISPSFTSDINITNSMPTINLVDNNNTDDFRIRNHDGVFKIIDATDSADRLAIDSSGRVGIGTSSPSAKLNIEDGSGDDLQGIRIINTHNDANAIDTAFIRLGVTNVGGEKTTQIAAVQENNGGNAVALRFSTNSSGNNNGETEKMRILGSGNVGIGTTSPTDLVDILNTTNNSRVLRLSHPSTPTAAAGFLGFNSDGSTNNNVVTLGVQYSSSYYNVLNLKRSTQAVGIGTVNPSTPFHVFHATTNGVATFESGDTDAVITLKDNAGQASVRAIGNVLTLNTSSSISERMRIDSAGNVLIGNTSSIGSSYRLQVYHATDARMYLANTTAASSQEVNLQFAPANSVTGALITCTSEEDFSTTANRTARLSFSTRKDGTLAERMRIDSSGKVHIGLTNGAGQFNVKNSNDTSTNALEIYNDNGVRNASFSQNSTGDATLDLRTNAASQTVLIRSNDTSHFNGGNVGIGTSSPGHKLHLKGTDTAYSNSVAVGPILELEDSVGRKSQFIAPGAVGEAGVGTPTSHDFTLFTNNTERIRIKNTGNVGIGTSSPSNDVHIQKAASGSDVSLRITNVTSDDSSTASLYFTTSPSVTFNTSYIQAVRDGGKLNFGYATNSPTLCMHVSADRVGIGNTGPEAKLDIESPTLGATNGNQQDLLKLKSPDVTNNTRYIFRNFRFTNGSSHTSSELRFFRKVDSTDMGYVGLRDGAITFGYGANEGMRMASDRTFSIGRNTSEGSQLMVDNQGEARNSIRISQAHQTALAQFTEVSNASYAGDGFKYHVSRAANSAFNFMAFDAAHSSTPDREFTIRGDGNAFADGTWNNNGADYAEFFESSTGSVIPVGTTVVLENNKVRAATSSDAVGNIIGVVRPKEPSQASMTIGNTAWNKWQGKYLTDDFDRFILDEHNVINWTDADGTFYSYESHAIPSDVTVPSDAVTLTTDAKGNKFTHYRLNPAYDSSKTYVPREDRDEWVIIGLVGQVKVLKGEVVNDRWIKMREVSDTVEEYFIR